MRHGNQRSSEGLSAPMAGARADAARRRSIQRFVRAALAIASSAPAAAGNLPVPCIATGSCGAAGPSTFVTSGSASATQVGSKLTVKQTSTNAVLNWQSFDIGKGSSVQFVQPSSTALAINDIFQGSPSRIFGSLSANGRVYLINQNGIMFGAGAQVNTAGLVASSLNLTQNAVANGIAQTVNGDPTAPSFVPFTDAQGNTRPSGAVTVSSGATLMTPSGGQIFLFAPQVTNQGKIATPDGQTILAAGSSVYLATSPDSDVRGLMVAVDAGGTVTNGSAANAGTKDPSQIVGQIVANRGNITLLGLAVNQEGLLSASTAVRSNGSILLIAADRSKSGTLTVAPNSLTQALLDATDTSAAVDQTAQLKSSITLQGHTVDVDAGAQLSATSGKITVTASSNPVQGSTDPPPPPQSGLSDGSRIYIAPGATLDVSGATAVLPMSANLLSVQLRGSELADDPLQRNGALRGQTVTVDVRQYGTNSDGSSWVGTPLANLTGDVATIERGVQQRNETGGTVALQSAGDVIVAPGATINVSGGASDYQAGYLNVTSLLGANGQLFSITNANPGILYTGVAQTSAISITDPRWGTTTTYSGIFGNTQGQWQGAYLQGADAGTLNVIAPHGVLDGKLEAATQIGPFQRKLPTALANGQLVRPYDQLPLPGALNLGPSPIVPTPFAFTDFIEPSVTFASQPGLAGLRNADGTPFNPLTDPWPASATDVILNPALIGPNAAGRVQIASDGAVTLPAGVNLTLPPGGSVDILGNTVVWNGSLVAPGAAVSLLSTLTQTNQADDASVTLGATARINTAGAWVNDFPTVSPALPTTAFDIAGGQVTLTARDGDLLLRSGAVIDVSGGAQFTSGGSLVAGKAGSINLSTSAPDNIPTATHLMLDAALRGYGVSSGGALTVAASAFCVTSGVACATAAEPGVVTVGPSFFDTGGFGSYALKANFGGLDVASGTVIDPIQSNYIISNLSAPSAPSLAGLATLGTLPAVSRAPVSLALSAQFVQSSLFSPPFAQLPSLSLERGAEIELDPLAQVTLTSNTRILDDARIVTPGGNVAMTVTATLSEPQFVTGHQLWIGPDAIIDVAGTALTQVDTSGHVTGSVLAGGSIALTALRGAVETEPGSVIDVSGSSATLDLPTTTNSGFTSYAPVRVASAAGNLSIQAAEAALLSGTLRASSGQPGVAAGGTFTLVLDGNQRYLESDFSGGGIPNYDFSPRTIQIAATQAPVVIAAGTDLPQAYDGLAPLSANALNAAGFDAINLRAVSFDGEIAPGAPTVAGQIGFLSNVALSAGRSVTLDAATFISNGGAATVSAPYVALGQTVFRTQSIADTPATGVGSLRVAADLIDLTGHSLFEVQTLTLDSSADIRANGVQAPVAPGAAFAPQLPGSLTVSGSLDLIAQEIYPSTLTSFDFVAGAAPAAAGTPLADQGVISVQAASGSASGPLLSAGGSLTLTANAIKQAGILRAPIGTITLDAPSITLAAGSVTSTSAQDQTIPFGTTQGGFDWVYPQGAGALVYGTHGIPLPSQAIRLVGATIDTEKGAIVDVRGGGNLLASEFVTGPTGTNDVLGSGTKSFAILPATDLRFSPLDPYYATTSALSPNQTLHLSGGGGIAAGTYAVLPARYALLPGAYLVTPESGYQNLSPGAVIKEADGSVVLPGYYGYAGTSLGSSLTSGFDVRPGGSAATVQTKGVVSVEDLAQYTLTTANAFFATQAQTAGVTPQRLPQDAGTVALVASTSLTLDATLEATPGADGRGAALDIASGAIRVVNGAAPPAAEAGVLDLDANALSGLGAESILLGGLRQETSRGLEITTQSASVEVASGAIIKAPELLLTATDTVSVDAGTTLATTGSLASPDANVLLSGDGALLRVATTGVPNITRNGTQGLTGQVMLASGSAIKAAGGSVNLDATTGATLSGTLDLKGGSLSISGPQISLGAAPSTESGIVLPASALSGLSVSNLDLLSSGAIEVWDGAALSGTNVMLAATRLESQTTQAIAITASDTLTLSGVCQSGCGAGLTAGPGTLALSGSTVRLQGDSLDLQGFGKVTIASSGQMLLAGSGQLATPGDLTLEAARLTAAPASQGANGTSTRGSGSQRQFLVGGAFAFEPAAHPAAFTAPAEAQLGATVDVTAASIAFDGSAVLHAGGLSLIATGGDVSLGKTASIDLSAVNTVFDSVAAGSPGGRLVLQSQTGSVSAAAGSVINIAALDDAPVDAGAFTVQAARGTVQLAGQLKGLGADVTVDGHAIDNFGPLVQTLTSGGFGGAWLLRLRGPGDLVIPTGDAITGHSVTLVADQGGVDVEGTVRSDTTGGIIRLAGATDVAVNGTLDALPAAGASAGGRIELDSSGTVAIGPTALIEAQGRGSSGGLWIRVPRSELLTPVPGVSLAGNLQNLGSITLEGYQVYDNVASLATADNSAQGILGVGVGSSMYNDAATFMSNAGGIVSALGVVRGPAITVVPGIEIRSEQTLALTTPWDLSAWRFNGAPGVLSIRSEGDFDVNASLSDGFVGTSGLAAYKLPLAGGPSWSYRLVAGADLNSSDPLAVEPTYQFTGGLLNPATFGTGSLVVAAGTPGNSPGGGMTMIRTGTGTIEIAAAGDLVLTNKDSVIYTAGIGTAAVDANGAPIIFRRPNPLSGLTYPTDGGDISIAVGGDIVGAPSPDLVTNWLWRAGSTLASNSPSTAWTVNFEYFEQGIGALGGGNVSVTAGGNIEDLSVSTPTVGRQAASAFSAIGNVVDVLNQGNVSLSAGGDIAGGVLYVGSGDAVVRAGDRITQSPTTPGLYPMLVLGDAQVSLSSRGDATLAGVTNVTLMPQGTAEAPGSNYASFFSTYGADSAVSLRSTAGAVELVDDVSGASAVVANYTTLAYDTSAINGDSNYTSSLRIFPGTLSVAALRGPLNVDNTISLYPESNGSLTLLAHDNVGLGTANSAANTFEIIESNSDPALLPTMDQPQGSYASVSAQLYSIAAALPGVVQNAAIPVHLTGATPDSTMSRIVSLTGDVAELAPTQTNELFFAAPARIVAGHDVTNVTVDFTNLAPTDVSAVVAGEDISYPLVRDGSGQINQSNANIYVEGPGQLELLAGRNFSLGTSGGVTSRATLSDPGLPPGGASIIVEAGLGAAGGGDATFIQDYLVKSQSYDPELISYMIPYLQGDPPTASEALSRFEALPLSGQLPLIQTIFFDELRASGRSAAAAGPTHDDFSRGYAAIQALFPGGLPAGAATNPYAGDISLYFSRVYTLGGGSIDLLAPGGLVNAGLATAPAAFGVNKQPAQLGIVAQSTGDVEAYSYSDFEVNQSRVFAADGGNILIWSSQGNIDAGRGAKTAISAPPPTITYVNGVPTVVFPAALTGSGIQTLATSAGVSPGDVDLFAPHGVVNANDAGIVAGNLTIAATAVLGASNIKVSGVSVGVPVEATGLGASLAGASSVGNSASAQATESVQESANRNASVAPAATAALGWLEVFIEGFGEEVCRPNDTECLKRQSGAPAKP